MHAVKIQDHLNKNWSHYKIMKWYQFFILYISNDIEFFLTSCRCEYRDTHVLLFQYEKIILKIMLKLSAD